MDYKNIVLFLFFMACSANTIAQQRQLVILKNETVLARYQVGDVLHFFRQGDTEVQVQKILDLNDTLIMMNLDSVAYYRITKLDIRGRKSSTFGQRLGATMLVAGLVLPAAELLNTGVIQKQGASISPGVGIASGVLVGAGAAFVFIKKPYFKPGRKHRMFIVDKRSPFYYVKSFTTGYSSPYMPR
jgi:hypothetical protein